MPSAHVVPDVADAPPPGYHYVTRPYRILPDGSHDYAILHGEKEFKTLQRDSGRLRRKH